MLKIQVKDTMLFIQFRLYKIVIICFLAGYEKLWDNNQYRRLLLDHNSKASIN